MIIIPYPITHCTALHRTTSLSIEQPAHLPPVRTHLSINPPVYDYYPISYYPLYRTASHYVIECWTTSLTYPLSELTWQSAHLSMIIIPYPITHCTALHRIRPLNVEHPAHQPAVRTHFIISPPAYDYYPISYYPLYRTASHYVIECWTTSLTCPLSELTS